MMWALENRGDDKYDHGDDCEVDNDIIIATTMLILPISCKISKYRHCILVLFISTVRAFS